MHVHLRMKLEPAVSFGLVGVEIIENHVDFLAGILRYDLVHEVEKLAAAAASVVPGFDLAGNHVKRGKQSGRSMAFIAVTEAVHRLAVGQTKIALSSLQGLYVRFLVNTDDHRFLRRRGIQLERRRSWCISTGSGFGPKAAELRVCRDAPTAPTLKLNAAPPEN